MNANHQFIDLDPQEYKRHDEAQDRRRQLKVIRSAIAPSDEVTPDSEAESLARDFSDVADAANLLYAHFGNKPHLLAFVYAVVGASGGGGDFIEITDAVLAERLGKSTKTVQTYRNEFREWADHGVVIEIKDNYRTPEGESHAHAYRCHLTSLAVETALNARVSPDWERDRARAMREAARTIGDSAPMFPPRKPKRRRKPSDAEMLRRNLQQSSNALAKAAALRPMVRNPDFEELYALRRELAEKLKAFDEAFELVANFHTNTKEEQVEIESPVPSVEDVPEARMEAETEVEDGVETGGRWKNSSTQNDSTESTVYKDSRFSSGDFPPDVKQPLNEPETVNDGRVVEEIYYPPGSSDEEVSQIWDSWIAKTKLTGVCDGP